MSPLLVVIKLLSLQVYSLTWTGRRWYARCKPRDKLSATSAKACWLLLMLLTGIVVFSRQPQLSLKLLQQLCSRSFRLCSNLSAYSRPFELFVGRVHCMPSFHCSGLLLCQESLWTHRLDCGRMMGGKRGYHPGRTVSSGDHFQMQTPGWLKLKVWFWFVCSPPLDFHSRKAFGRWQIVTYTMYPFYF